MKNKNRGFTLIELLAVIVIMVIIMLLAVPPIINQINKSRDNMSSTMKNVVYAAADLYVSGDSEYVMINGYVYCVTLKNLVDNGYLESPLIDIQTVKEMDLNTVVEAKVLNSTFEYTINNKCEVTNPMIAKDEINANMPNLHDNMIPIKYDGTKWVKADKENSADEWFDYLNQKWANAVTVTSITREYYKNAAVGTPVLEADILTYMVWIPRYEYKIEGKFGKDGTSVAIPGEIEVNFVVGTNITASSGYIMHPSFKFGSEELTGFWIGKFETSTADINCNITPNETNCNKSSHEIRIKPNMPSLRYINISNLLNASISINNNLVYGYGNVESHVLKNSEWGAAGYLSQSKYGKYGTGTGEVWKNNSDFITGCAGNSVRAGAYSGCQNAYDTLNGQNSSTTGNIYGVYDMSGGAQEFVMGNYDNVICDEGFTSMPESKYYDLCTTSIATTACSGGVCYGHALSETAEWYSVYTFFVNLRSRWLTRGGNGISSLSGGIFSFTDHSGFQGTAISSRFAHK